MHGGCAGQLDKENPPGRWEFEPGEDRRDIAGRILASLDQEAAQPETMNAQSRPVAPIRSPGQFNDITRADAVRPLQRLGHRQAELCTRAQPGVLVRGFFYYNLRGLDRTGRITFRESSGEF